MITRIELTNFMAHAHTVIEPAAGLTVLVGPNNCGKSAVVAALQILCHNDNSTYVLRHGQRDCSVKVETDDGHVIEWRRRTAPSYVIDGQLFDRLRGSGLPDELHRALRLPKVEAGDEADFDVHFGTQKSPVFLLGSSSANAARFFASSSDAIRLVQMQKRHKEKLQDAQREKNLLESESRQLNAELGALAPVIDLDRQLKALEAEHQRLLQFDTHLAALQSAAAALAAQAGIVSQHASQAQVLGLLTAPPPPLPTAECAELIDELIQAQSNLKRTKGHATALAPLMSPPALLNAAALEALCQEIHRLTRAVAASAAAQQALATLNQPPVLLDTAAFEVLVQRLAAQSSAVQSASQRCAALAPANPPPRLTDDSILADALAGIAAAIAQAQRCQEQLLAISPIAPPPAAADTSPLETIIAQLGTAAAQTQTRAAELETAEASRTKAEAALRAQTAGALCPICGAKLDADRLLVTAAGRGGHAHG